jgi:RES domain-containing protein
MPSRHPAAVAIRGIWWRHAPPGADPWHPYAIPSSNRWQRGVHVAALYLADSPDTAWAEWYRHLAEWALAPLEVLPRELWRFAVELDRVADLSTAEALEAVGLAPPRPTSEDWPPYQSVGERLFADGFQAVLAPSAARLGGRALCVFRAGRLRGVTPVPPPELTVEPPVPPRGMTT